MHKLKWTGSILVGLIGMVANLGVATADTPAFTNLSRSDFEAIGKELSANATLHTVMPASSLGSVFGFEVGLIAGADSTPEIERLVKAAQPSSEVSLIPHTGLVGAVSVPFGITGEVSLIPEVKVQGVKYNQFAAALKWNLSDGLLSVLPINLAVRGFLSKSELNFNQTVGGNSTSINYEGRVAGAQLLVSPKFLPVIEPYAGVGYLSAEGDMKLSGTTTSGVFAFTAAQSAETKPSSSQLLLGANVRLLLLVFGAEYSRAFETNSYTGKISFRF